MVPAHIVTADVDTNIAAFPLVESELLSTKSCLDSIFGHLQMLGANPSVMVLHTQSVVAPNNGCSLDGTACGDAWPALGHFLLSVDVGLEPVSESGSSCGK